MFKKTSSLDLHTSRDHFHFLEKWYLSSTTAFKAGGALGCVQVSLHRVYREGSISPPLSSSYPNIFFFLLSYFWFLVICVLWLLCHQVLELLCFFFITILKDLPWLLCYNLISHDNITKLTSHIAIYPSYFSVASLLSLCHSPPSLILSQTYKTLTLCHSNVWKKWNRQRKGEKEWHDTRNRRWRLIAHGRERGSRVHFETAKSSSPGNAIIYFR